MNYDCFTFFNEEDLLRIRLEEHNSFIDKFIIIEMNATHSGIKKSQNFDLNKFKDFESKIEYYFLDISLMDYLPYIIDPENSQNIKQHEFWKNENFQRNFCKIILNKFNLIKSDIILFSDLDEIIDQKTFEICVDKIKHEKCPFSNLPLAKVKQRHRYFKFNLCASDFGFGPRITNYETFFQINPSLMREYNLGFEACEGGWHFSYLSKNKQNIFNKMKSFSHAYQQDDVSNENEAYEKMYKMISYQETDNKNLPQSILKNIEKYKDFFNI